LLGRTARSRLAGAAASAPPLASRPASPSPRALLALLAHAQPFEPRQHLVAEERQLLEVVDEGEADAAQAGPAQVGQHLRDAVGVSDHQKPAHAVHVVVTLALELLLADGLDRNVLLAQDA